MQIVAIDPGTTTGIATFGDTTGRWGRWQHGPQPHHKKLWSDLAHNRPDTVVCETFIYQLRQKVILDSVEYIGVVKLFCEQTHVRYVPQAPAQGKGFWDDPKIRALGLWLPNMPHAMDATRHLLYYWMQHCDDRFVRQLAGDRGGA
jgi:hypothetical protein